MSCHFLTPYTTLMPILFFPLSPLAVHIRAGYIWISHLPVCPRSISIYSRCRLKLNANATITPQRLPGQPPIPVLGDSYDSDFTYRRRRVPKSHLRGVIKPEPDSDSDSELFIVPSGSAYNLEQYYKDDKRKALDLP